ncbi:MAG TPA: hypothetical protein VGQ90_03105 [Stellaceae bacterium]|nr:hypothetical protein [Stellaceae bacterium]
MLAGVVLTGCTGPHPSIREGNAISVEIGYSGDIASAWPLARKHCAQFERVPRLVDPGLDRAIFDCVRP